MKESGRKRRKAWHESKNLIELNCSSMFGNAESPNHKCRIEYLIRCHDYDHTHAAGFQGPDSFKEQAHPWQHLFRGLLHGTSHYLIVYVGTRP